MTTVVGFDGKMCSDSQVTRGDMIDNLVCKKIFEVGGCLIGISGGKVGAMNFVEWFEKELDFQEASENYPHVLVSPPEAIVDEDFHCLVMYPDKAMYEYFGSRKVSKVETEYAALGSGYPYAMAALDAGATPEKAIEVAIKRDVFSGGDVQVYELPKIVELTEPYLEGLDKAELIKLIQTGEVPVSEEDEEGWFKEFSNDQGDSLNISCEGYLCFGDGMYKDFKRVYDFNDYTSDFFPLMAELLGVKHAHNISTEKLVKRLDNKLQELLAELNK